VEHESVPHFTLDPAPAGSQGITALIARRATIFDDGC
jgi:hypothetical protein